MKQEKHESLIMKYAKFSRQNAQYFDIRIWLELASPFIFSQKNNMQFAYLNKS